MPMMALTCSSTARAPCGSRARATRTALRTDRAVRIPRRSRLFWLGVASSRTRRAGLGRSLPRRSATGSRTSAPGSDPSTCSDWAALERCHNPAQMKLVRMKPGQGDVLLAEGDPEVAGLRAPDRGVSPPARPWDVGGGSDGGRPPARGHHGARFLRDSRGHRAGRLLPASRRRLTLVVATSLIVLGALAVVAFGPALAERWRRRRSDRAAEPPPAYDPGRERRAEVRARELLGSVVSEEEYAMYAELGFI